MLVNRSFGLIKNHQGSKRKGFPGARSGRRAMLCSEQGCRRWGESCYPRELLRTVFNHFSSSFWVVHLTSGPHLRAGTHAAASLVFSRQGGQGEPLSTVTLPAAPPGAADSNPSAGECSCPGKGRFSRNLFRHIHGHTEASPGGRKKVKRLLSNFTFICAV